MVATVNIVEKNSSAGTATTKSGGTIRFKNADDATVDSNNRLVVPTSNTEYSYQKYVRFRIDTAPDVDITNIQAYMDGANGYGTGVKLWYAESTAFTEPATVTETNDPPHYPDGSTVNMSDAFGLTSGSPVTLSTAATSTTGEVGNHLVFVMEVESSATQGTLTAETLTFSYDET